LFEQEVLPVIEYYEKSNRLTVINGEQSIKDVHKDILKALDLAQGSN
jgi:adenylate kinase family enzyme